jgi:hypothetical protein
MLVVVAMMVSASYAQWVEPAILPDGGKAESADTSPAWNQAEIVFVGELTEAKTGPATRSLPPIYMNRLTFKVNRVLRGAITDKTVACAHSYRNNTNYPYEVGKQYIVALTTAQQTIAVRKLQLADDAAIKDVELACALPPGWVIACGETVSPWAGMGKGAWLGEMPAKTEKPKLKCQVTGRPALPAGPAVSWQVEPVPPQKSIRWTNPDGDGEYKLTVTNPTDQPLTVPALLTQDGSILWKESIVILCQERAYPCPGSKGVTGKVSSLVLKPKESVSTVVNALALQGPQWPRGGYRIEFTFCLGDKAKTMSFYYMSRHHDALRDAAKKPPAAETKTHALPADATATVIVFDYSGGMLVQIILPEFFVIDRYAWGRELGNENYKGTVERINIANFPAGEKQLAELASGGKAIILLCGCPDVAQCHRRILAERAAKLWDVEIEHLTSPGKHGHAGQTKLF